MRYWLILFLLFCWNVQTEQIQSARGVVTINNGDTYKGNSFWTGTIENLDNVTFIETNFGRQIPHTEVFANCTNLKFIDCNLTNVELQDDFIIKGSLTIHVEEYEQNGKRYREVGCGDDITRIYETTTTIVDIIDEEFGSLTDQGKEKIKAKYDEFNIPYIIEREETILFNQEVTPNDKKIKGIHISPNDTRFVNDF